MGYRQWIQRSSWKRIVATHYAGYSVLFGGGAGLYWYKNVGTYINWASMFNQRGPAINPLTCVLTGIGAAALLPVAGAGFILLSFVPNKK